MNRLAVYLNDYTAALGMLAAGVRHRGGDAAYRDGHLAPVLLLPGVYETWTFLRPLAERLHASGHPVHVVRGLGNNSRSIAASAEIAQDYIDTAGLTGVMLVAHSKGGLIGKHMMLVNDTAGRIDRLIAIATPFGGSRYARYMVDPSLRAFRPRSRTLAMLTADARVNARIISLFSEWDTHIPEGCRLEGATNIEFPVQGHFRILADERVLRAVDAALDRPAP